MARSARPGLLDPDKYAQLFPSSHAAVGGKPTEANAIIDKLYSHNHWPSLIYAALFEFMFFTGLLSEALAERWDVIDMERER